MSSSDHFPVGQCVQDRRCRDRAVVRSPAHSAACGSANGRVWDAMRCDLVNGDAMTRNGLLRSIVSNTPEHQNDWRSRSMSGYCDEVKLRKARWSVLFPSTLRERGLNECIALKSSIQKKPAESAATCRLSGIYLRTQCFGPAPDNACSHVRATEAPARNVGKLRQNIAAAEGYRLRALVDQTQVLPTLALATHRELPRPSSSGQ